MRLTFLTLFATGCMPLAIEPGEMRINSLASSGNEIAFDIIELKMVANVLILGSKTGNEPKPEGSIGYLVDDPR